MFRNVKIIFLCLISLSILGCASSGPIPIGQDTFMITKDSASTFASASSVIADLYVEANAFCNKNGKEFQPVSEQGTDGAPYRVANAQIKFRCLQKGDSQLGRPTVTQEK